LLLTLASSALLGLVSPALGATFTVINTNNEGAGSLRQAITEANAAPGSTIAFNIPGIGPFTIAPTSALPAVGVGTTIDGCTQPGASCSSLPLTLEIQLAGQGFSVSRDVTIKGLSFTGPGTAISTQRLAFEGQFVTSPNLTVVDNYLGLAPDGSAAGKTSPFFLENGNRSNAFPGLKILDNVIGSNTNLAISAVSNSFGAPKAMTALRIEGNIIGLDPTGTQPRPNGGGILLDETSNSRIVGNTIVGNKGAGIIHAGRSQATPHSDPAIDPGLLIEGNRIEGNEKEGIALGPDNNGTLPGAKDPYSGPIRVFGNTIRGNGTSASFPGIAVTAAAETLRPNVQIGGLAPGQGNLISGNTGAGVSIGADNADTSIAVTVHGNSIFENGGPRIDLASDGATENAPAGTVRSGPNLLVNHPLITAASEGSLDVSGAYEGAAETTVTLDFYASETAGGPQTWAGAAEVTTDAAGIAPFELVLAAGVAAGSFVDATATDSEGNTSEFSDAVVVSAAPPTPPNPPTPPPTPPNPPSPPTPEAPGAEPGPPTTTCAGVAATIVGSAGDDVLRGTEARDVIAALGGDDVIRSFSGEDLVCGGSGNDQLLGGPDGDRLLGQGGEDMVLGGKGEDHLAGGSDSDRILAAGRFADWVSCDGGVDHVVADREDHVLPSCEDVRVP
jgi:parallel beta-helix repeat protein